MFPASGGSNDPPGLPLGIGIRRIPGVSSLQQVPVPLSAARTYGISDPVPTPAARALGPINWVCPTYYASDPHFKEELLRLILTECQTSAGQQSQAVGVSFFFSSSFLRIRGICLSIFLFIIFFMEVLILILHSYFFHPLHRMLLVILTA